MGLLDKFTKKAKVIIDTNFLILLGEGIDIFTGIDKIMTESYELCVFEGTQRELRNISEGRAKGKTKGSAKFNAKLAFILIEQKGLKKLKSSYDHVDDAIVDVCKPGVYVATIDKGLQHRVKDKGARIIILRQKTHVAFKN